MKKSPLFVIFLTIFINLLGMGILIPVLPNLLTNPSDNNPYYLLRGLNLTTEHGYWLYGLLLAIFPLGQFLVTPIMGQVSDRYGRKIVLLLSMVAMGASYLVFAWGILAKSLWILFVSRAVQGFASGNIAVAQAAIADITTPENRAKNFGLIGAAFGLGFIFGPALGGILSDAHLVPWFGVVTPFYFAAGLCLVDVAVVAFLLSETNPFTGEARRFQITQPFTNLFRAMKLPGHVKALLGTNFFFQGGFSFYTAFISVYLFHHYHFTQGQVAMFFVYTGVWITLSQGLIVRLVVGRWAEAQILRASLFATGFWILLYLLPLMFPLPPWYLYLISPLFAISSGVSQAASTGLLSRSVDSHVQGEILGINGSVAALAQAIPPVLSGYLAGRLSPEAPLFLAALVVLWSGLMFITFYRRPADRVPA